MLRVTVDIYSGRPNPTWNLSDEDSERIAEEVARNAVLAADPDEGFQGLGFRGVIVETLTDDYAERRGLPRVFKLDAADPRARALADELVRSGPESETGEEGVDEGTRTLVLEEFRDLGRAEYPTETFPKPAEEPLGPDEEGETPEATRGCGYELGGYAPAYWNDAYSMPRNNCYNYATNRRTHTFAQPGRASGVWSPVAQPFCHNVQHGAISDGAFKHPNCAPGTGAPRHLAALVIWPGRDYHWYRSHSGGFWGHKPGQTRARNTDNSGRVITNPYSCDRRPYNTFCGWFYLPRTMRVR